MTALKCNRCGKSVEDVRLFDAIGREEIIKMCEECATIEGVPIIRRPNTNQLKNSEKTYTVRERLSKAAGLLDKIPKDKIRVTNEEKHISKDLTLDDLREVKKRKKAETPIKRVNEPYPQLVDNFNWIISRARVSKKITRKQIAKDIGESEIAIKMAETGDLPEDWPVLIKKIERYFDIKLIKEEDRHQFKDIDDRKPPVRIVSFKKEAVEGITIGDLRRMKKQKDKIDNEDKSEIVKMIWGKEKSKEKEKKEEPEEIDNKASDDGIVLEEEEVL